MTLEDLIAGFRTVATASVADAVDKVAGKRGYMEQEHGAAWSVMGRLKKAMDPGNIMNPGKLVPEPD